MDLTKFVVNNDATALARQAVADLIETLPLSCRGFAKQGFDSFMGGCVVLVPKPEPAPDAAPIPPAPEPDA